jgi:predicted nucleic acid-binding protein
MTGKTFVDTNLLIYAHDADESRNHPIPRKLLIDLPPRSSPERRSSSPKR